jgi:hypothetical protein
MLRREEGPHLIYCVECLDVPANVECVNCRDYFCLLCFQWLHKKGQRRNHTTNEIKQDIPKGGELTGRTTDFLQMNDEENEVENEKRENKKKTKKREENNENEGKNKKFKLKDDEDYEEDHHYSDNQKKFFLEKLKFIPLRLNETERKLLRLLEGALEISEYTDKVDVSHSDYGMVSFGWGFSSKFTQPQTSSMSKEKIIKHQLRELFSFLLGLYTSSNYRAGVSLLEDKKFSDNEQFFQQVFEVGRRFKIMNPDKMRSVYGKLMHILEDAVSPKYLSFNVLRPIQSVHSFLSERSFEMIHNDLYALMIASTPINVPTTKNGDNSYLSPEDIEKLKIERTERRDDARQRLFSKYANDFSPEEIELIINSISDCHHFIKDNTGAVEKMLQYLGDYFDPENERQGSLAIAKGKNGSCLSHSHSTQFKFVKQSLLLWHEIQKSMYKLWCYADRDMLNKNNGYKLCNTGQGLNRVQAAPSVANEMQTILNRVKAKMNGWVGLSVVHLGDRDVPNALIFIDKYTQVPWILSPIAQTLDNITTLHHSEPNVRALIDTKFGGPNEAKKLILTDFFRHGFDGSGDDGGSCIDGRLTSAWNWCSKLEKKSFYQLFMICGFEGFNGSYRR